jgi:hypothetical protein
MQNFPLLRLVFAVFADIGAKGEPGTSENSVADSGKSILLMVRII